MAPSFRITLLLNAWSHGDKTAPDQLIDLVYGELHRMAKRHMSGQSRGHTLQTTALIHEAYLHLVGQSGQTWQNRAHFFAVASKAMRRILVDHARKDHSLKRGGEDGHPLTIDDNIVISWERPHRMVALDDALALLEKMHPRQARIVEFRFFGGMGVEEVAKELQVSPDTVARDWRAAKAWLYSELTKKGKEGSA